MAPRVTQVRASPGKATEGADGVPGRPGRESGARWGQRCHQLCGQSVSKRMVRGFRRKAALRAVGGHRRSPSWLDAVRFHGFGRAGGLRRGRREYVPVGSGAPSMALTPLRNQPSRPRTVSVRVHPGLKKEEQEQEQQPHCFRGQIRFPQENGSDPSFHLETQRSCRPTPGYRMGRARVGWRGCPRHGCRGQAPRDGFTASPANPSWPGPSRNP